MISEETRRKLSEGKRGAKNPMYGVPAPTHLGLPDQEEFRRRYVDDAWTLSELAREYGASTSTVHAWRRRFGIKLTDDQVRDRKARANRRVAKGYKTRSHGYIHVMRKDHPDADAYGYVCEHRLVMEAFIGRPLAKQEQVHHIDGQKHRNEISNLALFPSGKAHSEFHKYLERVALYFFGVLKTAPVFDIGQPILFAGEWIDRFTQDTWRPFGGIT